MSEKSFVTLASRQCAVCGEVYETGELLINKHFKEVFDKHTVVGWGMCPECHKQVDEGYVAFVELKDNPKLPDNCKVSGSDERVRPTGRTVWIKKTILPDLIGEEEAAGLTDMAFISREIMEKFENMMED